MPTSQCAAMASNGARSSAFLRDMERASWNWNALAVCEMVAKAARGTSRPAMLLDESHARYVSANSKHAPYWRSVANEYLWKWAMSAAISSSRSADRRDLKRMNGFSRGARARCAFFSASEQSRSSLVDLREKAGTGFMNSTYGGSPGRSKSFA